MSSPGRELHLGDLVRYSDSLGTGRGTYTGLIVELIYDKRWLGRRPVSVMVERLPLGIQRDHVHALAVQKVRYEQEEKDEE